MKKAGIFLLGLLFFSQVYARTLAEDLPPNISIEVEFKEFGKSSVAVKELGQIQSINTSKYTKQHIVVTDGLSASIRVGEDVPVRESRRFQSAVISD